jgi:hypothetical protein
MSNAKMWNGELMPSKVRCFTFTNFNVGFDYETLNKNTQVGYIAYGEEVCPKTKRLHHQGWIYFHNQRPWTPTNLVKIGLEFAPEHTPEEKIEHEANISAGCISAAQKKILIKKYKNAGAAHVEPMGGSLEQNVAYCSKEGKLVEFGNRPKQGNRTDLKGRIDEILNGETTADEIACSDPMFFHQYGRTLDRVEMIKWRKQFRSWKTKGTWYYGTTGVGKSYNHVFKGMKDFNPEKTYVKICDETFWDRYTGQEEVVLDEFRGQMPFSYLLQLTSGTPMWVKIKGKEGFPMLAKEIFITSPKPPEETYTNLGEDEGSMDQLYRRFTVYQVLSPTEKIERTWEDAKAHIQAKAEKYAQDCNDNIGYDRAKLLCQ